MKQIGSMCARAIVASCAVGTRIVASEKWLWYLAGIRFAAAALGILTGQPAVSAEMAGCGCG